jgi:hypothetical protein
VPAFEVRESNVRLLNGKLSERFQRLDFQSIAVRNKEDLDNAMERYNQVNILPKIDLNQDSSTGWIPGELGYWFSNYAAALAFNEVSKNQRDVCLLFDDDVWLNVDEGGVLQLIPRWIERLPSDWDFFNLYVIEPQRPNYDVSVHGDIDHLLCRNYSNTCTVATAWSKNGMRKLTKIAHSGINNPLDVQIFASRELNGYTLLPEQQGGISYFSELQYYDHSTIRSNEIRFNHVQRKGRE